MAEQGKSWAGKTDKGNSSAGGARAGPAGGTKAIAVQAGQELGRQIKRQVMARQLHAIARQ